MTRNRVLLLVTLLLSAPAVWCADAGGAPVQNESLAYNINWPSGLSLGEARVISHFVNDHWYFEMVLDAGVPGFAVSDRFSSIAGNDLCSLEFGRETLHGKRRTQEKTTFDYKKKVAHRVTLNGGGKNDSKLTGCARDALSFVILARRELGLGRVPSAQTVYYGSQYTVKMDFAGPRNITYNDKKAKADKATVTVKGPASDFSFEIYFALDAARTPLVVKVPLSVGMISAELVR